MHSPTFAFWACSSCIPLHTSTPRLFPTYIVPTRVQALSQHATLRIPCPPPSPRMVTMSFSFFPSFAQLEVPRHWRSRPSTINHSPTKCQCSSVLEFISCYPSLSRPFPIDPSQQSARPLSRFSTVRSSHASKREPNTSVTIGTYLNPHSRRRTNSLMAWI